MNTINGQKLLLRRFSYADIALRLLQEDDLKETLAWRNYYNIWFKDSNLIDFSNHLKWFEQYQLKENDFVFIIEDKNNQKLGQVAIYNIDRQAKSGEFGRLVVNPSFAGLGYMKKACKAVMLLSRDLLNLSSLYLEVKANNERAKKIYESCGFILDHIKNNELIYYKAAL